ncbi:MAG: N-glycanase [Bacteroidaceae bacterium]|nr:N-glycanase [Bacteroidaceae bacterium]
MRKRLINLILAACALTVQAAPFDTVYNNVVFNRRVINFDEAEHPGSLCREADGTLVIANGRIVLRKVCLPRNKRDARATVSVRLRSHGDRWDKAGSVFVIPCSQAVSMLTVADGTRPYPPVDAALYENMRGIVSGDGYRPCVELIRFMTPFGVGFHTPQDSATAQHVKPTWLDRYEDFAEWSQDVTDRLALLQDSCYIGLAIDTWTHEGYEATVSLTMEESAVKGDKAVRRHVLPLVNTIEYYQQEYCDLFARRPLEVPFTLPRTARRAMVYYVSSGHGGHSGGDEFVPSENVVSLDGNEVCRYTPWRADCYSFRRFNPATGVWLVQREATYITSQGTRGQKVIEETLASSDLSRSGWCPGSDVPPMRIPLGTLAPGAHTLTIAIPTAQPAQEGRQNHWLVTAWLVWEE